MIKLLFFIYIGTTDHRKIRYKIKKNVKKVTVEQIIEQLHWHKEERYHNTNHCLLIYYWSSSSSSSSSLFVVSFKPRFSNCFRSTFRFSLANTFPMALLSIEFGTFAWAGCTIRAYANKKQINKDYNLINILWIAFSTLQSIDEISMAARSIEFGKIRLIIARQVFVISVSCSQDLSSVSLTFKMEHISSNFSPASSSAVTPDWPDRILPMSIR